MLHFGWVGFRMTPWQREASLQHRDNPSEMCHVGPSKRGSVQLRLNPPRSEFRSTALRLQFLGEAQPFHLPSTAGDGCSNFSASGPTSRDQVAPTVMLHVLILAASAAWDMGVVWARAC